MPCSIQELYPVIDALNKMDYTDWLHVVIGLNRIGDLPNFLELINREDLSPYANRLLSSNRGTILIIGDSDIRAKEIEKTCKAFGINKNRLELVLEYKDNYDFRRTQSHNYSLILVGPLPHMAKGVDGASSIITKIMTDDTYPPVIKLTDGNGKLNISKNSLINALSEAKENRYITVC